MARIAALCLLVAVVAAACTPTSEPDATTVEATTVIPSTTILTTTTEAPDGFGGAAAIGVTQPVTTLNPFMENAPLSTNMAGQAVWATVYDILPDTWERMPNVVTSLPSQTAGGIEVAEDGSMTVRYQIAPDAVWSDGAPIVGADIAFTAEQMALLASRGSQTVDPVMASVIATEALDRIAWITFSEASLAFEDALWVILPSHAIDAATNLGEADGFSWPSGGPFVVSDASDPQILSLERNTEYWKMNASGERLPYLDGLTFIPGGEAADAAALFSSRTVDVIVAPQGLAELESNHVDAEVQQVQSPLVEQLTFQFGDSRNEANPGSNNDDRNYREAIAYAIDREDIVDATGVPWSPRTPGMLVATGPSAWDIYSSDPSTGADLVASLSGDGDSGPVSPEAELSTTSELDDRVLIGDALVRSFAGVGIDLDTSYLETLIFFGDRLGTGEFDIGMWAWSSNGGYGDQLLLMERFDAESGANVGNWGTGESASDGSAAYSELVSEARTTVDAERFVEIVHSAEGILAEYIPVIPLFRRTSVAAVWTDSITGIAHNGSRSGLTWNVEIWQKPGE